ncbi:MAG: alpha/beta hydrolase [Bdellovibrionales bacterium]
MEVISFGTAKEHTHPLLFVHGSYCAAWIWERYFLPYFAEHGFHGAAISLRGHGQTSNNAYVDHYGIQDFLEDIDQGTKLFNKPPILIGHSLGGYLVQRYALTHEVRGMALLASPSLSGLGTSSQHILTNNPLLSFQLGMLMLLGPLYVDQNIIGRSLFLHDIPEEEYEFLASHFQRESSRVTQEAFLPCLLHPQHIPPTLVLGGASDAFIPESDLHQAAQTWNAELKIMDHVPHGLMIDPCWPKVADVVKTWLEGI